MDTIAIVFMIGIFAAIFTGLTFSAYINAKYGKTGDKTIESSESTESSE